MKFFKLSVILILVLGFISCGPVNQPQKVQKQSGPGLDEQMNRLTSQIIASFNQSNVRKIAVIEFADLEGNVTQLGRFLAEELLTRIFTTGKFEVVERNLLQTVLEEQKLGTSGYIDQETAISIGQILGVDAIITGSITDLGENVKINARLISTESGSVFAVASVNVIKDDTIRLLMGESVQQNGNAAGAGTSTQPQYSGLKPPIVKNGVQFELQKCFYSNEFLTVILTVTNLDPDKEITLYDRAESDYVRFIDEQGREYRSPEQFLGTHKTGWNGIEEVMMVQDVGTQYTLKFRGVKPQPTDVKRLDLLLYLPDLKNYFTITFRDIPVE
ncbi:MAG TPA: FlgO family outer membrane protein [Candidatus Cloacimonadota bacterium]|nr:FlgO family outer membrane protein [Candidatus Cloacimonadota bacterium]